MKTYKFFACALAVAAVFTGCNKGDEPDNPEGVQPTAITLSQAELTVEEGQTANLAVAFTPSDATGTLTWASSDDAVATVTQEGIVTGVAEGTATIVVTCGSLTDQCEVSVTPASTIDTEALLSGSDYYVFSMDETTFGKLGSKVTKDFRMNGGYAEDGTIPDGVTSVLQIWGNTLGGVTTVPDGPNSFGLTGEGWIGLDIIAGGEWSGSGSGGIFQLQDVDFTKLTDDHYLVITYKAPSSNGNSTVKFVLYSTTGSGAKVEYTCDANTNGEWTKFEVPVSDIKSKGIDWSAPYQYGVTKKEDGSDYAMYTLGIDLTGNVGAQIHVDAAFIYKPAE